MDRSHFIDMTLVQIVSDTTNFGFPFLTNRNDVGSVGVQSRLPHNDAEHTSLLAVQQTN